MGNKPSSVSEGEDDEDRLPLSLRPASTASVDLTNGGGDEPEEEVLELPPPMKPIQEPILPQPTNRDSVEENPCKRVRICLITFNFILTHVNTIVFSNTTYVS